MKANRRSSALLVCGIMALAEILSLHAQDPVQAVKSVSATRESMALSYPEGTTISIKFQGTSRLPSASGEAKVERKRGMTEIEIELDEMKPAKFFGGDYNTYVLWTVSPEGHVDNVGEFILRGNRSKLDVSTPLETFGMFITAEPHFLVASPSRFVVMENTRPVHRLGNPMQVSQIKYRGFDGIYSFQRESLANVQETKGEIRPDIEQARTSVQLALRSGAAKYAQQELAHAREALAKAEAGQTMGLDKRNMMLEGHEVVRIAVEAQKLAEERAFQAALDAERKAHSEEAAKLERAAQDAQTDAERAKLLAQQKEMQLQMEERARQDAMRQAEEAARRAAEEARRAEEQARRAAEEERQRHEAEGRAAQAQQQAQQLAVQKSAAEADAERARKEREESRARMEQALGKILETRDTARGLILNLPGILFDTDKATLRPAAREVLAKVSGILLVARGYRLTVEGHTDNVGDDEYNRKLSEMRALSVRDYLVQSGLPATMVTTQGFGKTQPIAPNTTAEGRQRNRRVEIVVIDTEKADNPN